MNPRIGSLFTGYGGLDLAVEAYFGAHTVWTSDIDPGACKIITHRFPDALNIGDITQIDWTDAEPVEILTGGFPCQDVSTAGKRAGLKPGTRSGLWSHMAYAIDQLRPRYVIAENVRGLLSAEAHSDLEPCPWCLGDLARGGKPLRALGAVLGDLAVLGYDATWVGLRAADVGAPHGRFRVFVVACDANAGQSGEAGSAIGLAAWAPAANADRPGPQGSEPTGRRDMPHRSATTPYPPRDGRNEGRAQPARLVRGSDAAVSRDAAPDATVERRRTPRGDDRVRAPGLVEVDWGQYGPAIARWEHLSGRVAPAPTETGPKGGQRLAPRFVEWMMGIPAGWVTDVPDLSRNAQLKALGNGVVPQQAHEALRRALT